MMTKAEMIEAEFDEPFDEVIKGFAEMGYSRRAVAEILEINLSYLRLLLRPPWSERSVPAAERNAEGVPVLLVVGWP